MEIPTSPEPITSCIVAYSRELVWIIESFTRSGILSPRGLLSWLFDIPTLAEILGHAQKTTTGKYVRPFVGCTKEKSAMARFNRSAG